MVDIHHHLLFGIDDGSKTLENSVEMVKMAVEDGITHIVATPHANDRYPYSRERNEGLLQQIRDALPAEVASKITLGLGCDFHVNFENTEDARKNKQLYTINQHEYLLVELPDIGLPARTGEIFYDMRIHGMTPILTHPERNATLQRTPDKLRDWLQGDLLVQVTAGSVTGTFGSTAESMAWDLLEKHWVHFIATDAHNLDRRPPVLSEAYQLIAEKLGEETAERLCVANPLAVFEGRPLPPQPDPLDLYTSAPVDPAQGGVKPSLWQRLFG
jgi:protein-tyrosine phosphatase